MSHSMHMGNTGIMQVREPRERAEANARLTKTSQPSSLSASSALGQHG